MKNFWHLLIFLATFFFGITISVIMLLLWNTQGLYVLAAVIILAICLLLDMRGRGHTVREMVTAGLVLSVGAITGGHALGHVQLFMRTSPDDQTIHILVALIALLMVYTWMWKYLKKIC